MAPRHWPSSPNGSDQQALPHLIVLAPGIGPSFFHSSDQQALPHPLPIVVLLSGIGSAFFCCSDRQKLPPSHCFAPQSKGNARAKVEILRQALVSSSELDNEAGLSICVTKRPPPAMFWPGNEVCICSFSSRCCCLTGRRADEAIRCQQYITNLFARSEHLVFTCSSGYHVDCLHCGNNRECRLGNCSHACCRANVDD
jgi:hypothetical protein